MQKTDIIPKKEELSLAKSEKDALGTIQQANDFLIQTEVIEDIIKVENFANIAQAISREKKYDEARLQSIKLQLRAQRKAGTKLLEMPKNPGSKGLGKKVPYQIGTTLPTLKDLGITPNDSTRWQSISKVPEERFQKLIDDSAKASQNAVLQVAHEFEKEVARVNAKPIEIPKSVSIKIIQGEFQFSDQAPESIDAIITDPPYGKVFNDWKGLGQFAQRVLKPGSFLAAYSGQSELDSKMAKLSESLKYYWIIALKHKQVGIVPGLGIQNAWKPILVYGKEPIANVSFYDFIEGLGQNKEMHDWGQAVDEAKKLIELFSDPGDTIFEPFAGGGSTIEACIQSKRNCVAYEKDPETYKLLKKRFPDSQ